MKTRKEIVECLAKLRRLRDAMPRINAFGESNYDKFTQQIKGLEALLPPKTPHENTIRTLRDNLDYEEHQSEIEAYDWVLEENDEPLVDDRDLEHWEERAKAGTNKVNILPPPRG